MDSKGLAVPGVAEPTDENDAQLSDDQSSRYRFIAARMNYLAQDRMDMFLSVKELCRCMSSPTTHDWKKLMEVGN